MKLFSIILATITRFVHHLTIQAHNILLRIVDFIWNSSKDIYWTHGTVYLISFLLKNKN